MNAPFIYYRGRKTHKIYHENQSNTEDAEITCSSFSVSCPFRDLISASWEVTLVLYALVTILNPKASCSVGAGERGKQEKGEKKIKKKEESKHEWVLYPHWLHL